MAKLDSGTTVDAGCQVRNPVSAYTCPDLAEREWQAFFSNYPQVVGLSADLPGPGSFLTCHDFGKPILCTRDEQGAFRAFLNVCRHRGAIVESEARGEKQRFNCPFHAWGYGLGGELLSVPKENHFGPVERDCHGLKALPAEERFGLLWVHPQPDGEMDLDRQLGDLGAEFEDWDLGHYAPHGQTTYEHPMNWKLAIDTFGETYHFNTLHRDSLAHDFHGNVQLYDTYGRNHRMMLCLKNIDALRERDRSDWHVLSAALRFTTSSPTCSSSSASAAPPWCGCTRMPPIPTTATRRFPSTSTPTSTRPSSAHARPKPTRTSSSAWRTSPGSFATRTTGPPPRPMPAPAPAPGTHHLRAQRAGPAPLPQHLPGGAGHAAASGDQQTSAGLRFSPRWLGRPTLETVHSGGPEAG